MMIFHDLSIVFHRFTHDFHAGSLPPVARNCLQAGLEAMRDSGKIPRGPPDLPTGDLPLAGSTVLPKLQRSGEKKMAIPNQVE